MLGVCMHAIGDRGHAARIACPAYTHADRLQPRIKSPTHSFSQRTVAVAAEDLLPLLAD